MMNGRRISRGIVLCLAMTMLLRIEYGSEASISATTLAPSTGMPVRSTILFGSVATPRPDSDQAENSPASASKLEALHTLAGHNESAAALAFLPDSGHLASLSGAHALSLWDVKSGNKVRTITKLELRVYNADFSRDGALLAVGNPSNTIGLWNVRNGKLVSTLKGHNVFIMKVAFSPDSTLLASGDLGA